MDSTNITIEQSWIIKLVSSGIFKIIFTLLSIFLIILLFSFQMKEEYSTEPLPSIKTKHDEINGKPIREITKNAKIIYTGIYLEDFPKFSIQQDYFIADLIVWFKLPKDKNLFKAINNFAIENGNILKQSKPIIQYDKNFMLVKHHIRVDFKGSLRYQRFPFDDHRITLQINNRYLNPTQAILQTKREFFVLSKSFKLPDWEIAKTPKGQQLEAFYGFIHSPIHTSIKTNNLKPIFYSTAGFSFLARNTGWFGIFMIFIPLFILFFLILVGLLLDITSFFRLSGTTGLITTMILSYRLVLSGIAPQVGYLTLADKINIFIVSISSLVLVYQVIVHRKFLVKIPKHDEIRKKILRKKIIGLDSLTYCITQLITIFVLCLIFFLD